MKRLATTKAASKKFLTRAVIAVVILLTVSASTLQFAMQSVSADPYDDKINALQQDISNYQAQADVLNGQSATLQTALAQLANERAAVEAQISLNQTQYDQLTQQIADTEQKIKDTQDALGETIADLYVDGKVTPIEMLASSGNISDYLNKQEYRSSIRDQLTSSIKVIKDLRQELADKRAAVETVLNQQKSAQETLVAKEAEQANLLAKTQNDEANYQNLIKSSAAQIEEAKATQAAIRARINGSGGYTIIASGSLSDYPWNSSNCPMLGYLSTGGADGNGNDGRGYGCRQCASYAAWRIAKETNIYYNWGNAVDFTRNAINAGYKEGAPKAGSIAVMDPAKAGQGYGHVAWVESVNGDGTVTVSQYNYDYGQGYGMYSKMVLSVNAFDHYIYIK